MFTLQGNLPQTPEELATQRAMIAQMMPQFGSARYVGEGLGHLATGLALGAKMGRSTRAANEQRDAAGSMFENIASQASAGPGSFTVNGYAAPSAGGLQGGQANDTLGTQSPSGSVPSGASGDFMPLLNSSLRNAGFNDDYIRASEAIMGGETSGDWTLTESDRYSPGRAREIFPDIFGSMSDGQISALSGTPDFFETTYGPGTSRGRRLGNVNPGDGYRYRGRGPHQVTGRANYERLARLTGHDIVNNPELLVTDPRVAADVTAAYMVDRVDQRGDPVADVRAAVSGSYTGRGFNMNIDADRRRFRSIGQPTFAQQAVQAEPMAGAGGQAVMQGSQGNDTLQAPQGDGHSHGVQGDELVDMPRDVAASVPVDEWLRMANQNKVRNDPLSDELVNAFSQFLPEMGITVEVFSGGQEPAGTPGGTRTGSTRHDHGNAADVVFYKDGRQLNWANPDDVPIFQEIVRRGRAAGLTGFGAGPGYMREGSMHIGFGSPAAWGAGGSSANAPQWLREAFNSAPQGVPSGGGQQTMRGSQGSDTISGGAGAPAPQQGRQMSYQMPQYQGAPIQDVYRAMGNPWMNQGQRAVLGGLAGQAQQYSDPLYQLQYAQAQYQLQNMGNPAVLEPTSAMQNYQFLISQGVDPETAMGRAFSGGMTVNVGDQAAQGPQIGTIPQGYSAVQDPTQPSGYRMEAIGGGPEDPARQNAQAAERSAYTTQLIDGVLSNPNLGKVTGTVQGRELPTVVRSQGAVDLITQIDQLQGQAFLQAFESLKGGGQITEREGIAAQNAIARLNRVQSEEAFRQGLMELREISDRGRRRALGEDVPDTPIVGRSPEQGPTGSNIQDAPKLSVENARTLSAEDVIRMRDAAAARGEDFSDEIGQILLSRGLLF